MNTKLAGPFLIALAACMPDDPATSKPPEDPCGASAFQRLMGAPRSAVQAEGFAQPVRIIPHGRFVTLDYNPLRINFALDESGKVFRITCG